VSGTSVWCLALFYKEIFMKNKQKTILRIAGIIALFAIVGFSMVSCASAPPVVRPPSAENVRVSETVTPRGIIVQWNAVELATDYNVVLRRDDSEIGRWTTRNTTFTIPAEAVRGGQSYVIWVWARNNGNSSYDPGRAQITTSPETVAERTEREARVTANNQRLQALEGSWVLGMNVITFTVNRSAPAFTGRFSYKLGTADEVANPITNFTENSITSGNITFNYSISGNRITITNHRIGGYNMGVLDGTYTKR